MNISLHVFKEIPFLTFGEYFQSVKFQTVKSCVKTWFRRETNSAMGVKLGTLSKCCIPLEEKEKTSLLNAQKPVDESVRCGNSTIHCIPSYSNCETRNSNEHVVSAEPSCNQYVFSETERAGKSCISHCDVHNEENDQSPHKESGIDLKHSFLASAIVPESCPEVTEASGVKVASESSLDISDAQPKKKRRKKDRGGEHEITKGNFGVKGKKITPNYFVAFKVSNPEIHHHLDVVQRHMIQQDSRLEKSLINLSKLHITMMVMHLENDEEHSRALGALKAVHNAHNENMSKNPLELEFRGLGHFYNKVLFAKISSGDAMDRLTAFADDVNKYFQEASIYSTDGKKSFNPHLTIMKLSKDRSLKYKNINKINPSLYSLYKDTFFGNQIVDGIQLLSMTHPAGESNYYYGTELPFELLVQNS